MNDRFSRQARSARSVEIGGSHSALSANGQRADQRHSSRKKPTESEEQGPGQGSGTAQAKRVFFYALIACLPVMIVGSLFHSRVVVKIQNDLTRANAQTVAAQIDALVGARASAVRMAAVSLEIENLTASGGLNRLLGNLKELFPDFRSLEIFNVQGQPLAMMGELSLAQVNRQSRPTGPTRPTEEEGSGVGFFDEPAEDCFYLTLRHVAADSSQWISRTRFSREAMIGVLSAGQIYSKDGPSAVSINGAGSEEMTLKLQFSPAQRSAPLGSQGGWRTRTYLATAPLALTGWAVSLERVVPVSRWWHVSTILPALILAISGLWAILSAAHSRKRPKAVYIAAAPMVSDVPPAEEPASDIDDKPPVGHEGIAEACYKGSDGNPFAPLPVIDPAEVGGESVAERYCSSSVDLQDPVATSGGTVIPESDAFYSSDCPEAACRRDQPIADLSRAELTAPPAEDPLRGTSEAASHEALLNITPAPPLPPSDGLEQDPIVEGEPVYEDPLPDTLDVCWAEPDRQQPSSQGDQSTVKVVRSWYVAS